MKALTLWQPWASAIALGSKRIETRSWSTNYRGPLAIHAAKRRNVDELIYYGCCWNWCGALGVKMGRHNDIWDTLPFGAIVATCELVDCRPTETFTVGELDTKRRPDGDVHHTYAWTERQLGNFDPGRFGWLLADIVPLDEPVAATGRQGLWDWQP